MSQVGERRCPTLELIWIPIAYDKNPKAHIFGFFLTSIFGRFEAHLDPEIPLKPALALVFLSI